MNLGYWKKIQKKGVRKPLLDEFALFSISDNIHRVRGKEVRTPGALGNPESNNVTETAKTHYRISTKIAGYQTPQNKLKTST